MLRLTTQETGVGLVYIIERLQVFQLLTVKMVIRAVMGMGEKVEVPHIQIIIEHQLLLELYGWIWRLWIL